MPNNERVRHDQMKLRFSEEMKAECARLLPLVEEYLLKTVKTLNSDCPVGEVHAAARYLAKSLAEYCLRKKNGVRDAKFDPEVEISWREDRVLKGKWQDLTGYPVGSVVNEATKRFWEGTTPEKVELARRLRNEIREAISQHVPIIGGARYGLANAIRHAWLVCHGENNAVSYARQTNVYGDHVGDLHNFIKQIKEYGGGSFNVDELHKEIREIDKRMHPLMY